MDLMDHFETTYFGTRYYVEILDVFKHHYTGEKMFYIRMETVNGLGHGMAEDKVVSETQLKHFMEHDDEEDE